MGGGQWPGPADGHCPGLGPPGTLRASLTSAQEAESQPPRRGLPCSRVRVGLQGPLTRRTPELPLWGKVTKKTRGAGAVTAGRALHGRPTARSANRGAGQVPRPGGRAPGRAFRPRRLSAGLEPRGFFFFKAKLSFYLDKLFKKCK